MLSAIPRFGRLTLVSAEGTSPAYVSFNLHRPEKDLGVVWIDPQGHHPNVQGERQFQSRKLAQLEQVLLDQYEKLQPDLERIAKLPPEAYASKMAPKRMILKEGLQKFLPDVLAEVSQNPLAHDLKAKIYGWTQIVQRPNVTSALWNSRSANGHVIHGKFFGPAQPEAQPQVPPPKGWQEALKSKLTNLGQLLRAKA